ncbi:MAG: hypothetical protein DRJ38_00715 [Thermoprotei archaeon]|nr:MAG: hypothetical protein DRJ38_00715 [Thermoprotei archaeon]
MENGDEFKCPICGSNKIIYDQVTREYVCSECGYVVEDREIDYRYEKRIHSAEDWLKSRIGPKQVPYEDLTPTDIGFSSKEKRRKSRRIRSTHKRIVESKDRNFRKAKREIIRLCNILGINSVCTDAILYYKKASSKKLVRGRSIEGMATACVYAACKARRLGISLNVLEKVSKVSRRLIARNYRLLIEHGIVHQGGTDVFNFVTRIAAHLKLSTDTIRLVGKILKKSREKRIGIGARPEGLVAASIYISSIIMNSPRTQREIAKAANITEVTLRNRYKEIMEKTNITVYI